MDVFNREKELRWAGLSPELARRPLPHSTRSSYFPRSGGKTFKWLAVEKRLILRLGCSAVLRYLGNQACPTDNSFILPAQERSNRFFIDLNKLSKKKIKLQPFDYCRDCCCTLCAARWKMVEKLSKIIVEELPKSEVFPFFHFLKNVRKRQGSGEHSFSRAKVTMNA